MWWYNHWNRLRGRLSNPWRLLTQFQAGKDLKVRPVCPTGQLYPLPYQSWVLQSLVFEATTHSILLQVLGNSTDHGTPFRHPPNFTSTIYFKLFENNNFTRSLTKAAFPFPVKMLCTITVSSQTILTQTDAWKKDKKIPFYLITPLTFPVCKFIIT